MAAQPSDSSILHLVLTRFNVRSGGKEFTLRTDPGWLAHRFQLFDRFCFPSMVAQTRKEFRWLVFFDSDTPQPFRDRIEACRSCNEFQPAFVSEWTSEVVRRTIEAKFRPEHDYLLTTRLDNDDGLNAGFIEALRAGIDGTETKFYNFTRGLIYHDGLVYRHDHPSNAFISLFEPIQGYETVWKKQHQAITDNFAVEQLPYRDAWFQVIHERNVSNRVKGRRIRAADWADGYAHLASIPLAPDSPVGWIAENVIYYPGRQLRERAISLAKMALQR